MHYNNKKLFVTPIGMRDHSHALASQVWRAGYRPTHIVALWRGGAMVALHMDEYFALLGSPVDCVAVRTSLYADGQETHDEVRVHSEQYLVETLQSHHRVLFVDDILESGRSVGALQRVLREKLGQGRTPEFRVATLLTKSEKWQYGNPKADYFVRDVPEYCWVVFPHELEKLSLAELASQINARTIDCLTDDMGLHNIGEEEEKTLNGLPLDLVKRKRVAHQSRDAEQDRKNTQLCRDYCLLKED